MKYKAYSVNDFYLMLHRTRDISGNPYMLFTAYLISSLSDILFAEDDDETGKPKPDDLFGMTVPAHMLKLMLRECLSDFREAAESESAVEIFGKPYSIRKAGSIDYAKLADTIKTVQDGDVTITKELFNNVTEEEPEDIKLTFQDNRRYSDAIMKLADETKDGWDLLTDVEVLVYCWMKYCQKHTLEDGKEERYFREFARIYKDFFYISEKRLLSCLQGRKQWPITQYSFSAEKIRKLNGELGQASVIDKQP